MINSFDNEVNCTFTTEYSDLIDSDFLLSCNYEQQQQQQIAVNENNTSISTSIESKNCRSRFNNVDKKTHTYWPREEMYVKK